MILEVFILLQKLAVIGLVVSFFSKTPFASALTIVMSGILMVGAWSINTGIKYVWDPSIRAYVENAAYVSTPYLPAFNMILFGLALLYFYNDMMDVIKGETEHINMDGLANRGNGREGL